MSELKVPTVALAAEVACADGRSFVGRIFVPAAASHHSGPTRPEEWLNEPVPFFPFLPDDSDTPVILNKSQVLVVSTVLLDAEEDLDTAEGTPSRAVAVECEGRRVEGTLRIDMPTGHRRVLDYLNRHDVFLALRAPGRLHLVHKSRITRLIELREG